MEDSFQHIWALFRNHGGVAYLYEAECARVWSEYSIEDQREIYRSIRRKLQNGQFVHYNPVRAIQENAPKKKKQVLSYDEYYKQYRTTEEQDGWKRVFLPEKRTTIYVKNDQ